jgi:hypothetical protein
MGENETFDIIATVIISSEHIDLDEEIIVQDGIETKQFMKTGYLCSNTMEFKPRQELDGIIGVPLELEQVTLDDGVKATQVKFGILKSEEDKVNVGQGVAITARVAQRDYSEGLDEPNKIRKCILHFVFFTKKPLHPSWKIIAIERSKDATARKTN